MHANGSSRGLWFKWAIQSLRWHAELVKSDNGPLSASLRGRIATWQDAVIHPPREAFVFDPAA
jgi:hypothetical protein